MIAIWLIFLFALGACVGSFLNVVIYRLPRGQSIVFPGSHCPRCGRPIRWYDNLPILSWIILGGRCRACRRPISPRYLVVEAVTATVVAGLFVWFYVLAFRQEAGTFGATWPTFVAHAALLCGLLACAIVDIEHWIVPLEVCWFISLVGVVRAAAWPAPEAMLPPVAPATGAAALGGAAGLAVALVLLHYGFIQQSFLDADQRPDRDAGADRATLFRTGHTGHTGDPGDRGDAGDRRPEEPQPAAPRRPSPACGVAITKAHGVNPRVEVLREVIFLAPALLLAVAAWLLVSRFDAAGQAWRRIADPDAGAFARHFSALLSALCGYLVGGLWIWGMRILGTLAFGKEAMGMGDVHILAAVGAVTGWIVPSLAFFLSAFLAVAWAIALFISRRQRELPYGPWLAAGTLMAILFNDPILEFLRPRLAILLILWR